MRTHDPHGWWLNGPSTRSDRRGPVDAALAIILAVTLIAPAGAQDPQPGDEAQDAPPAETSLLSEDDELDLEGLMELSIEQLMEVKVTSVAGRAQPLRDTPAAIYVITAEDLRRSGHRSLAEALRMVPGFTVGQISPSIWAVGSRGLVDRFSNDLLVLIDGRTVYDPLFSGVFWNVQDVLIEDLDRIEVIRGPGATLWGANAVNGVINVTTKSARDTQGLYLNGGGGNVDQGFGAIRYGGAMDESSFFRVWAKYDNHASFDDINGQDTPTDWDMFRGGTRFDWHGDDGLHTTLQAEAYGTNTAGTRVRVPVPGHLTSESVDLDEKYQGGHVLFRTGREISPEEGWTVQAYYDRTETRGGQPGWEVRRDTFEADYRQYVPLGDEKRHVLMWGLSARHTRDRTDSGPTLAFDPEDRSIDLFNGFVQDTITIIPDELFMMVGSKFEYNDQTEFEYQPSGRLSWSPDPNQTVWGAISRAVRIPSRIADDVRLITAYADTGLLGGGPPSGTFVPLVLRGDSGIDSEELLAYEIGYRVRPDPSLTIDVAAYYNDYDEMITFPLPAGTFGNRGEATSYGVEVASSWRVHDAWTLHAAYTFTRIDFESPDGNSEEGETPQNQFNLRSYLDVTDDLEFNAALYYVDNIPDEGAKAYIRLDLGLTWRPQPNMELAIWGQNLLDNRHLEFGDDLFQDQPIEVERSVYAQLSLRF